MKTASLYAVSILILASSAAAKLPINFIPSVDAILMNEFDEMMPDLMRITGLTDTEEDRKNSLSAKARAFEVGEEADVVVAALIVRGLSHTENSDPPLEWKTTFVMSSLVRSLRYSPNIAPHLAPALREWLQYLVNGKSPYYHPAMVEESAIYLLHWGGDAERPFLEKIALSLIKNAEANKSLSGLGETIRRELEGNGRKEILATIPFYQWCGNIVENARKSMEGSLYPKGTGFPEYEAQQKAKQQQADGEITPPASKNLQETSVNAKSNRLHEATPASPSTESRTWVYLIGFGLCVIVIAWLLLKKRK